MLSGVLLLMVLAGHWTARRMLYRRAAQADLGFAAADLDSREQYVLLSRNIERREHERLLHDTVLNTLTALTRPGCDTAGVVGRCRHDVTLMEFVLSAPGGAVSPVGRPYGELLAGIEAVASEMRTRGLDVHVKVTGDVPAGSGARTPDAGRAIPVPVAVAMAHAVREALTNVASHAGTGAAWVETSPTAPGGPPGEPSGVQVTVRDAGAGFDPARVDPGRLGLQRSIIERIADLGGQASVWSAPGEGTVVRLRWTASENRGREAVAVAASVTSGPQW